MATYPSDPALPQTVDGVTTINQALLNTYVDNINAIGSALADIAAEDGHVHLGSGDKRVYFNADAQYIKYDTGDSRFEFSDEVYQETVWCLEIDSHAAAGTKINFKHGILIYANSEINGNFHINGTLSKSAGAFLIDHPLDETKNLWHGFIEGPEFGLLYRGKIKLVNGKAIINIDQACRMSPGVFESIATNPTVFLQNSTGFTAIRPGEIVGAEFEIMAEDPACGDEVSWMVCAERKDKYIMESKHTHEDGRLILEPLKEVEDATAQ